MEAFDGFDGQLQFGHVHLITSGSHEGQWRWTLSGLQSHPIIGGHRAGTPREVAAYVEDEYDRFLPESDGLHLRYDAEIAHYQERGIPLPVMVQWRKAVFVDGMPREEADALFRPDYKPNQINPTHPSGGRSRR